MSVGIVTALRGWLHRDVRRAWERRGVLARLMYPLLLLHWLWRGLRAAARFVTRARPVRLPVPVIVVGNLTVGGTGKTPLVVETVNALRKRGWSPGIVSRGFGGHARLPLLVDTAADPAQCGDEPLLMRIVTGVPVAVGRDRVAAARLLLATNPGCNVLVADDGLQHWKLGRDIELAILNSAGLGNGWLLPAGPMRDPPERLQTVDAVVLHGIVPPVRIHTPFYRMRTSVHHAVCLAQPERQLPLSDLAAEQQARKLRLLALCAIGSPERYFAMLREQGLRCDTVALPDHAPIDARMLAGSRHDRILVTEKDAVKCHRDAQLRHDQRIWVVPLDADIDAALFDFVAARLEKISHGPEAAGNPGLPRDQGTVAL